MGSLSGHCLCGDISYDSDADPAMTAMCHCDDCQRSSGSAFSVNLLIEEDSLTVTGTPAVFETVGAETGEKRERMFCARCGSQVFTKLVEMEGMIVIKAGTLDDRSAVAPELEIWTETAQPWHEEHEDRGAFPRGLPT